ncbi:MAG: tetratricopeptide repeat protein [Ruminococcus sp.]|nr:tetratricopeptide repeat protein [Ruminococcus sp.]
MSYNEILDELRAKLTGTPEENDDFLRREAQRFASEGNSDGFEAASELLLESMPEAKRNEIKRITHVDGVRLDKLYLQILQLMKEDKYVEAKSLAERLYKKITVEFKETDTEKFVSFRNPFEDQIYHVVYKPEKTLRRAPYDFAEYITSYAYIIFETGSPLDAIPILEKAAEFNPVDCGPKFELAEVYKILKNRKRLQEVTRETLHVASSPAAIARCYANMGYSLTDAGEFEDAAAFYVASVMMAPNPAIPRELQHLADLKGSPIVRPEHDRIVEVLKKYDMEFGPHPDVIRVCAELSAYYLNQNDIPNALHALKMTYTLTLDENVKNIILKYDPLATQKAEGSGITQTVNEAPDGE